MYWVCFHSQAVSLQYKGIESLGQCMPLILAHGKGFWPIVTLFGSHTPSLYILKEGLLSNFNRIYKKKLESNILLCVTNDKSMEKDESLDI